MSPTLSICQFCQDREATVHLTSYPQGEAEPRKADLCEQCAKALEIVASPSRRRPSVRVAEFGAEKNIL